MFSRSIVCFKQQYVGIGILCDLAPPTVQHHGRKYKSQCLCCYMCEILYVEVNMNVML